MRRALLLAFLTACTRPAPAGATAATAPAPGPAAAAKSAPGGAPAVTPAPLAAPAASARAACVDAQLAARNLNQYGDPPGTVYVGGTPLFDERTSVARDRVQYILDRHPEIGKACAAR